MVDGGWWILGEKEEKEKDLMFLFSFLILAAGGILKKGPDVRGIC